jgi:hypothetical protein
MKFIFTDYKMSDLKYTIQDARWKWGNGWVRCKDGVLLTKWRNGTYELVAPQVLRLCWAGLTHLVRFDANLDKFISIRIGDLDVVKGESCI